MWSYSMVCLALLVSGSLSMSLKNGRQADESIPLDDLFGRADESIPLDDLFGRGAAKELGEPPLSGIGAGVNHADTQDSTRLESVKRWLDLGAHSPEVPAKGNRSLEQRQQSLRDNLGDIEVCFYCDQRCVEQIANTGIYADSEEYFNKVIDKMNPMLQTLDDSINLEMKFVFVNDVVIEMSWFVDFSISSALEKMGYLNDVFWRETGLYDMAVSQGCDVDYLVGARNDPAWNHMGSVQGVAGMMQMCIQSFSTVQLDSDPFDMALLMSHEMGHLMGMYHDGMVDSGFTNLASYFQPGAMLDACAAEYTVLTEECTYNEFGCDERSCIMDPVVSGAVAFSDCSKAYYAMWHCLMEIMPNYYTADCVGHD